MKIIETRGENLESTVYLLLAARARGEHVYAEFNRHVLCSDDVTMDSAYIAVIGCTKAEYDEQIRRERENWKKIEEEREIREQRYREKVKADRAAKGPSEITAELVVAGLKFIAEHLRSSHDELLEGLLSLGCNFTLQDIREQFPECESVRLFDGMKRADVSCGASIIVNVRDSEFGRSYGEDRFFSVDDEISAYHFVRKRGDKKYTKDKVDVMVATSN